MKGFLAMAAIFGLLAFGVYGAVRNWNECRATFSWVYCFSHEGKD